MIPCHRNYQINKNKSLTLNLVSQNLYPISRLFPQYIVSDHMSYLILSPISPHLFYIVTQHNSYYTVSCIAYVPSYLVSHHVIHFTTSRISSYLVSYNWSRWSPQIFCLGTSPHLKHAHIRTIPISNTSPRLLSRVSYLTTFCISNHISYLTTSCILPYLVSHQT